MIGSSRVLTHKKKKGLSRLSICGWLLLLSILAMSTGVQDTMLEELLGDSVTGSLSHGPITVPPPPAPHAVKREPRGASPTPSMQSLGATSVGGESVVSTTTASSSTRRCQPALPLPTAHIPRTPLVHRAGGHTVAAVPARRRWSVGAGRRYAVALLTLLACVTRRRVGTRPRRDSPLAGSCGTGTTHE